MTTFENYFCYFCDELCPSWHLTKHSNDIWYCENCEIRNPINIEENGECCVCFDEDNLLVKLPNCIHKVCIKCFKTIFLAKVLRS